MTQHLHVGGVVALGFDSTGRYLLVVSHDGRGLFDLGTWTKIARDRTMAYPDEGKAVGIGPIDGEVISVNEIDYDSGMLALMSPDDRYQFFYESGTITITENEA